MKFRIYFISGIVKEQIDTKIKIINPNINSLINFIL